MKKSIREEVYNKYNGHCAYCGTEIQYKDMQVDHIISKYHNGPDDIENYMPTCRRCNHYKRAFDLEGFRTYMMTLHERVENNYIVKVAISYGIVKLTQFDGIFYFEKGKFND